MFSSETTETRRRPIPTGAERRRHRRHTMRLAVRELRPEQHVLCATKVSASGLSLPDAPPRPLGTILLLEITIPDGEPAAARGRVVRTAITEEGWGVAVALEPPCEALAEYLARQQAAKER